MKKNKVSNITITKSLTSTFYRTSILPALIAVAITGCSSSSQTQDVQSKDNIAITAAVNHDEFVINDNVALNKEYRSDPDGFKKKYLNKVVTFDGFYYRKNPFDKKLTFLLKYPNSEKIGTDPIDVVELRFNTLRPENVPYSYFSNISENKYWIYDGQDNKLIEQMNVHNGNDVNEQPLSFYKPKLIEYIDEHSHETRGYLLSYNDNALQKVFKKYSQLFYKPTTEDDFDYNKVFILSTVTVKGKVDEINAGVDGSVWLKLTNEKIVSIKNGFVNENTKLIDVGALKGMPNSTPDSTSTN